MDRALDKDGHRLHRCREDSRAFHQLGHYYVIDIKSGGAWPTDIDLEDYAREMGVLKPYERLADESDAR